MRTRVRGFGLFYLSYLPLAKSTCDGVAAKAGHLFQILQSSKRQELVSHQMGVEGAMAYVSASELLSVGAF